MDSRRPPAPGRGPLLYGCLIIVIILAVAAALGFVVFVWDVNQSR